MAYNAIDAIIGIEKKAQEIIEPATKAQESLQEGINAEKEKIYSAKKSEYQRLVSEFKADEEKKAELLVKKARVGAAESKKRLDEIYEKKHSEWLDTLFKNVSGQV